jgi:hypothetical protein
VSGGSLSNATTTIGTGAADAKLASSGEHDLTLQTGNATTGSITITDGANGNIAITPNGTGEVDISKVDIDGGAIDGTAIGSSSASTGAFSTVTASGAVTANANLSVKNGATSAGTVTLYEDSDDGSNYAGLKAGIMASDVTWTLPTADGTSGQVISTDGSGALSWSSVSGGSLTNATTSIGTGAATANLASDGDYDLVLKTGNSTTGSITITDGANGNITVTPNGTGQVDINTDLTVTGNDITFGNGETISNATDGDFLFTTGTAAGALTLKNSNGSDGIAAIELVSDAGAEAGDGYELQSLNGTFTITSDHSTSGTYNDTYLTIAGNSTPASSTTTIAGGAVVSGDLTVSGNDITFGNGETISNATDGDFLFTTGTIAGALTLKNSNGGNGIASIEMVSDAGAEAGDGYELQSLNGTFTITSDHSTSGTYNDTYLTIAGNSTPSSSTTTIAGGLTISADLNTNGAVYREITSLTSDYTITSSDGYHVITNDGASADVTITLPDPTGAAFLGRELIFIVSSGYHNIDLSCGGNGISHSNSALTSAFSLGYAGQNATLICDGVKWCVVGTSAYIP